MTTDGRIFTTDGDRILVSHDGGESWREVVHPADGDPDESDNT